MSLIIRFGQLSDAPALADLARRTYSDTFAASTDPNDLAAFLDLHYGAAQQSGELADTNVVTLLADDGGALAGFVQLRVVSETPACVTGPAPMEIGRFYVDRAWHGRGVAKLLMDATYDEARRRGARTLWLGVWEHNERAKAFYRKYGFVDVGSHPFIVGSDIQTDRLMERRLPAGRSAGILPATP